jgi:predicted RNA-binding Zn ribbon-like protein
LRGIVPPYRMLDPALRDAAALRLLAELVDALPDERAAAERLDAELARRCGAPCLHYRDGAWHLCVHGDRRVVAVALLVAAGGWRRLKRCARNGCTAVFVDRTGAATRRHCQAHLRGRVR